MKMVISLLGIVSLIHMVLPTNTTQYMYEHDQMIFLNGKHTFDKRDYSSDNLAVGHEASPDTQLPPEEIGQEKSEILIACSMIKNI